ncbi:MAG: molybdopterin-guanine dinucleotide biosynthesis protein B, partial [Actinobacteria bacterium]|nr:molybdopterin-guanine dinucleotide biosynthesis protein B [Actinomycetota bacterium]
QLEAARGLAAGAAVGGGADGADAGEAPPAPRVLDFLARAPLPTVSFVGKKKSGKTTVLAGVIGELVRRGRRVAVIKSDQHGFAIDVPGTDTYVLREAGADVTAIASPEQVAVMSRVPQAVPLLGLVWRLREPVDIVLTEGFVRQPAPKIEVSRAARSDSLIAPPDELLAIVSDQRFPEHRVPQIDLDDVAAVAELLERQIVAHRRRRGGCHATAPTPDGALLEAVVREDPRSTSEV